MDSRQTGDTQETAAVKAGISVRTGRRIDKGEHKPPAERTWRTRKEANFANHGIKPIKTPQQSPKVNAICERVVGTLRRECLDYVIPLSERHLRRIMKLWVTHYNRSRPHCVIGLDIPSSVAKPRAKIVQLRRNSKPTDRIIATPILGGLHHDYQIMAA